MTDSPEPDMLQAMFDMQMKLNQRIGVDPPSMDQEEQTKWVLNYCRATSQELAELTDSVPWKWWAKYQEFDLQNARVEVVDLFHFIISLGQVLGMDAADIHNLYMQKNRVNFERQDSGYSEKDEGDNQDLEI
jgi:dimeric dUTPase (all-alpha-NTP-PPase superfamily)